MKRIILFIFILLMTVQLNAQSMLVTYQGGYFIKSGNTWYNYKPSKSSSIWASYSQYSSDSKYFYVKNSNCKLCIPKSNINDIYIFDSKTSKYNVLYNTIQVYGFCPKKSNKLFCFDKGFFIKENKNWSLYLPQKNAESTWASFTQYKADENYYYIKNSNNKMAIPRKRSLDFHIAYGNNWKVIYKTSAIYDASNNVNNNPETSKSSSSSNAKDHKNKKNGGTSNIFANSSYKFKYQGQPEVKPSGKFKYNPNAGVGASGVKPSGKFKYNPNASSQVPVHTGTIRSTSTSYTNNGGGTTKMRNEKVEYIDKIIYAPNYTGDDNREWCNQCNSYSSKHSHVKQRVW